MVQFVMLTLQIERLVGAENRAMFRDVGKHTSKSVGTERNVLSVGTEMYYLYKMNINCISNPLEW